MDEQTTAALPKELTLAYEKAIARNVDALMQGAGLSQVQLTANLKAMGLDLGQGNLSQMLSGQRRIPLSLVVYLCEYFKVSLADLVNENFGRTPASHTESCVPPVYSEELLNTVPYLGDKFVVDPSDPHFFGYLQTYHVYFFPSQGDDIRLRTGKLRLQARGPVCEAILEVNTNKIRDGKPYIKVYRGRCIISTTMRAVYILLTDPVKGELSVLNFRYHNLGTYPLDCGIACILLNSTGVEHPPTTQRMFLSRTEIAEEHLPLLIPHLTLNNGILRVRQDLLEAYRLRNPGCHSVIDELMLINQPQSVYNFDEDDILTAARRHLTKSQVCQLLSELRSLTDDSRTHKASRRADMLSHKLLRSLGYYHDHDDEN